jgi:hypothetical protein
MPDYQLVVTSDPLPDQLQYLEDRIYEFNSNTTGITDGNWLAIFVRIDEDRIAAEICGNTWGGCLEIRQFLGEGSAAQTGLGNKTPGGSGARGSSAMVLPRHLR